MQTNQLEGTLIVSSDRFPFIQQELGSAVEVVKEYTSEDGRACIQFYFKLVNALEVLSLFHAGVSCGCKEMAY